MEKPAIILEVISLEKCGVEQIPGTFEELTGNGKWTTHIPGGRTKILVDLTVPKDMQGNGYADRFLESILRQLRNYRNAENLFTYSPVTAVRLHEKHGAAKVREILGARSRYHTPDVAVMQYPIEKFRGRKFTV
jgi:hypothetical protein